MAQVNDKDLFAKMLVGFLGDEDPMLAMLKWIAERMIEIESELKVGAKKSEHSTERTTHFSGYRPRRFDTRMGTMYLMVPKVRKGGYVPFFITDKKRSEQALMSLVREAYVNGVSTRKIERLAKSLGIDGISASQVSEINKGLDDQVNAFRTRPLNTSYPVLWVDALYEKVREDQKIMSMAVLIVYGITDEGKRDVLAVEPMYQESEATWAQVFQGLKSRGLTETCLIVSDAHLGIQAAVKKEFLGASWQRCKVHFMRNIMAHVSQRDKTVFAEKLKTIWLQPDKSSALQQAQHIRSDYEKRFPEAMKVLDQGLEDSLVFYDFPELDKRKISSTNILERFNREIRRRSRVVSIFPSRPAYIRLITAYIMEYVEDWEVDRSYMKKEALVLTVARFKDRFKQLSVA